MAGELAIMTSFAILFIFMADLSLTTNETADAEPFRCKICDPEDCFAEFVKLGDFCYHFSKTPENWDNSRKICTDNGADLAYPMNKKESLLITNHMRTKFKDMEGFHLGGNNKQDESKWVWSFNNRPIGFTNWAPTEPDKYDYERCLLSYKPDKYKWHNIRCSDKYPFVCQQISA